VAAAFENHVRLPLAAGHFFDESLLAAERDLILVAVDRDHRAVEAAHRLPGLPVVGQLWVVRRGGEQLSELSVAAHVAGFGVGGVVGVDDFLRQLGNAQRAQHFPVGPVRGLANHLLESGEGADSLDLLRHRLGRIAQEESRVRETDTRHPVAVLMQDSQSDDASPVVQDQGDVGEIQHVDERRARPLDVTRDAEVLHARRLVGSTEADQIYRDRAISGRDDGRNDAAPQVRPARISVDEDDRVGVARPLVQVVHAQRPAFQVGDLCVVRLERVPGQVCESLFGGSDDFHGLLSGSRRRDAAIARLHGIVAARLPASYSLCHSVSQPRQPSA
jgi:hypothetical protein